MKRIGYLYNEICSIDNLILADKKARRGKSNQSSLIQFDLNREDNIINLHHELKNKEYKVSNYTLFTIHDPKERVIYRLPYKDRIVQHAILNILEPILVNSFTKDTYSCIKKRGIHGVMYAVKRALKDIEGTQYCLKFDIQQFYPSINHSILKSLIRKKFKDKDLLWLLDEIIDSTEGCPIGNYSSQFFANLYLNYFDHWLKEVKKVKYLFRYCDDICIFSNSKKYLHNLLLDIREYLNINLKLTIKANHQVFPISKKGLDFVGYKFYHTHIRLRKGIKLRFISMIKHHRNKKSIASYYGWLSHANCKHLIKKYILYEQNRST